MPCKKFPLKLPVTRNKKKTAVAISVPEMAKRQWLSKGRGKESGKRGFVGVHRDCKIAQID